MLFDGEIVKEEFFVELFRVKIIWRVFMVIFLILQCGMTIKKKISLDFYSQIYSCYFKTIWEAEDYFWIESFRNQNDWTIWKSKRSTIFFHSYSFTNLTFILVKIYPICLKLELLIYKYAICIIVYRKYQYNSKYH